MKSDNNYYIVLDYCNGGDLESYLQLKKQLHEDIVRIMVAQLVDAMHHLYLNKIIHRDLKPANIFVHFPNQEQDIS